MKNSSTCVEPPYREPRAGTDESTNRRPRTPQSRSNTHQPARRSVGPATQTPRDVHRFTSLQSPLHQYRCMDHCYDTSVSPSHTAFFMDYGLRASLLHSFLAGEHPIVATSRTVFASHKTLRIGCRAARPCSTIYILFDPPRPFRSLRTSTHRRSHPRSRVTPTPSLKHRTEATV